MSTRANILSAALWVLASGCGQKPPAPPPPPTAAPSSGVVGKTSAPPAAARAARDLFLGTWHRRERDDDFYLEVR